MKLDLTLNIKLFSVRAKSIPWTSYSSRKDSTYETQGTSDETDNRDPMIWIRAAANLGKQWRKDILKQKNTNRYPSTKQHSWHKTILKKTEVRFYTRNWLCRSTRKQQILTVTRSTSTNVVYGMRNDSSSGNWNCRQDK